MKKLLALLFVCAGLAAFAAPQVSQFTSQANYGAPNMVAKGNTLVNQLTAPAMKMAQVQSTDFIEFFKTHDIKDNMVRRQNASSRISAEEFLGPKLVMLSAYDWKFNGDGCDITPAAYQYMGGWDAYLSGSGNNVNVDGIYYNIPIDMVADYANNTISMPTGDNIYTYNSGRKYVSRQNYVDTTEYGYLVNEGWFQNEPFADVVGEILPDGTVYFEDGWAYLFIDIVDHYTSILSLWPSYTDTVYEVTKIFRDTYFLEPNAHHTYYSAHAAKTADVNCYMYQYDDNTAIIWNIYGLGMRGVRANIYADGRMEIPIQVAANRDVSSYAANRPEYDWTGAEKFYIMQYDVEADNFIQEPVVGTCTNTQLKWDCATSMGDLISDANGTYFGVYFYPWTNNEINFFPGNEFVIPEIIDLSGQIVISDVAADGKVNIVYTGEEAVELEIIDQDGNEYTRDADNNIQLPAYGEYTIIVTATADGYNPMEESRELVWESQGLRGDVNGDGCVDPSDITALINYLLIGAEIDERNADSDLNGEIDPSDITALINYLLTDHWND